jgi:hypothetical protein
MANPCASIIDDWHARNRYLECSNG